MSAPKEVPELTLRAVVTGFVLGALLVPCNVYSGLKIGWSFNMSVAAALLGYALWNGLHRFGWARAIDLKENNINQTAASSSASIISAGLVAPIPALTLLTGKELAYPLLVVWVFVVSFTGVVVAIGIRRQMLLRENLPFPNGVATAETIREIYATGAEAAYRVRLLLTSGLISGGVKLYSAFISAIPSLSLPASIGVTAPQTLAAQGFTTLSMRNLGFTLEPSLLMLGFGAIVGLRVGISLVIGAVVAWLILPPWLLANGWVAPGALEPTTFWYSELLEWLLWPGVMLMVAASLTSFALSLLSVYTRRRNDQQTTEEAWEDATPASTNYFPRNWFRIGFVLAFIFTLLAQMLIFGISWWLAATAFLLTFVLAIVAARVSGETGIPPIGALGKVTQVTFGALAPANTTVNLMAANVTGGAAGQCSDLLHDLKTGLLIKATLRYQAIAQVFGVLSGSLAGTAAYLIIIPDPQAMLLTPEWPAPAVATWKAVAEVLAEGFDTIPPGSLTAVMIAAVLGVGLSVVEHLVPARRRILVPSAASLGFAFIIPASISLALFLGALAAWIVGLFAPDWRKKYVIVVAAGLVAGESIAGVLHALSQILFGA